jgi:outer membrane protein TolC
LVGSLVLAGFLAAAATGVAAGETLRLSLRDAVARALSDGTTARIATERIDRAQAQAREARAELLPQVRGEVEGANESLNLETFGLSSSAFGIGPVVGPFSLLDFHVVAALRVVDLAALRRYDAARQDVTVSMVERRRTENEVIAAVAALYVEFQRAQAAVENAAANVELFGRLRDLADDQRRSGVGTRVDTTRAEVALARQRTAWLNAQNARDAAGLALLHAIGADQAVTLELIDPPESENVPAPAVADALSRAEADRPELESLAAQRRVEELRASAERGERLPTFSAQLQGGYNGNHIGDLSWTRQIVGLFSVPIFTGGRISAREAEANSRIRELDLQRIDLERQVEEEVRRAILDYESARERSRVANESLALAQEELELSRDRFTNGVASSIEVDNAQDSLVSAQADRIAAAADRERARFALWRATGQIRELAQPGRETP